MAHDPPEPTNSPKVERLDPAEPTGPFEDAPNDNPFSEEPTPAVAPDRAASTLSAEEAVAVGSPRPTGDGPPGPRGRQADKVSEIPQKGWRDILLRVKGEIDRDNIGLLASGVAFWAMLALFPALAALISIWGLVADPLEIEAQLGEFAHFLPSEALDLVRAQLQDIASSEQENLGWGLVVGLALSLWSATKGTRALIIACNTAYDERENRGFLRLNAMALLFTVAGILFAAVALALLVVVPLWAKSLGSGEVEAIVATLLRWPLLAAGVATALAILYRFAPNRSRPKWRWVTWGSSLATLLWMLGSAGFSFYVANFGSYNETYGAVGGVIVTLMWFYLTAYIIILGAELNAEIEHQTLVDTTESPPQPMGARDAFVADTVGEVP